MNVLIFGATGMIGSGVLIEALADARIKRVVSISRRSSGVRHAKFEEILHSDFFDYRAVRDRLSPFEACFFCLGVSAAGKAESTYRRLTFELTLAAARTLCQVNPEMTFCYVSGTGTDASEKGRIMWARIKGETENALVRLPFKAVYLFRPGYIQPMKGVRSGTTLYQIFYTVFAPLYPMLKWLFPGAVTNTERVGRAMIEVGLAGYPKAVLETRDINLAASVR